MPTFPTASARSAIVSQLPTIALAWSVNGRDVRFLSGFDLGVEPAGFITVTTPGGARYLVQVHELAAVNRRGIEVDLVADGLGVAEAGVERATVEVTTRMIEGAGQIVRRLDGDGPSAAFDEAAIALADAADVGAHLAASTGAARIEVGAVRGSDTPGALRSQGFARHTFMCGQSGSGKTYSLGVVIERLLLDTDLPIVIVDPNSDYVNMGRLAARDTINRFRRPPLSRQGYVALRDRFGERADVLVASAGSSGDVPLAIHLSDLTRDEQALVMQLDPIADPAEYTALADAAASLGDGPYGFADLAAVLHDRFDDASRALARRLANLDLASWSVWADAAEPSLVDRVVGRRAVVLDTGSLPNAHERSVVSLALLGRLRRRPQRAPIAVVIDEAHNVCPPDGVTALDRAVTDLALWIAGEGRKYGIYLLLSTQRPQKIHRNVLSQCDNLLLMRVNSASDLEELTHVFSHVPAGLIREARTHRMGELLAAGPVAPTPLRLRMAERWTMEGGADLPTDWATPSGAAG